MPSCAQCWAQARCSLWHSLYIEASNTGLPRMAKGFHDHSLPSYNPRTPGNIRRATFQVLPEQHRMALGCPGSSKAQAEENLRVQSVQSSLFLWGPCVFHNPSLQGPQGGPTPRLIFKLNRRVPTQFKVPISKLRADLANSCNLPRCLGCPRYNLCRYIYIYISTYIYIFIIWNIFGEVYGDHIWQFTLIPYSEYKNMICNFKSIVLENFRIWL